MKTVFLCSFTLLMLGLATLASAGSKADILRLEQDFNAAYAANDLDKYFGYYADDAILWFQDGRTDLPAYKKEWAAFIKSGGQIQDGTTSDMHVRFSPQGDAAIASYLLHLETKKADQTIADETFQETDVWFKAAGAGKSPTCIIPMPRQRCINKPGTLRPCSKYSSIRTRSRGASFRPRACVNPLMCVGRVSWKLLSPSRAIRCASSKTA
jgi:ketosteroid isomerase-like protein